jgi:DNA-binding NarL/FixJ family response regulator
MGLTALSARTSMKKITVVLADDHAVLREGLRLLLQTTDDIAVVGEADNGHRALNAVKNLQPDVVLLDIAMPLLNGVEATRRIALEVPATKVIILSAYHDHQHVQEAVKAGASGYLTKQSSSDDLLGAIREISAGKASFSPPVAQCLSKQWRNGTFQFTTRGAPALTTRQMEVVQLIAEGFSSKQIAHVLMVSPKTVDKHRQAIMLKLNIHEIASLTRYAVFSGIVESNYIPLWPALPIVTPGQVVQAKRFPRQ